LNIDIFILAIANRRTSNETPKYFNSLVIVKHWCVWIECLISSFFLWPSKKKSLGNLFRR